MKQKSSGNSTLTRNDLIKTLKQYPTKDDLTERLTVSQNAPLREIDYKFILMREELHKDLTQFTNRILTAIDPLLLELETRQQDREINTAKMVAIEDDVEHLKKRVTKLEHS